MTRARPTWGEVFEVPPTTTADDLLRMPDDGAKYELYEGVLVREMTFAGHGALCQRLGFELGLYARTSGYPNSIVQNTLFDRRFLARRRARYSRRTWRFCTSRRRSLGTLFPTTRRCSRWR